MTEKIEIMCTLCGEPIERPGKGYRAGALTREQQERVHSPCKDVYSQICSKYTCDVAHNFAAIRDGLYELFPELKQTKEVKAYHAQVAALNNEIYAAFPNLKRQQEQAVRAAALKAKAEIAETKGENMFEERAIKEVTLKSKIENTKTEVKIEVEEPKKIKLKRKRKKVNK